MDATAFETIAAAKMAYEKLASTRGDVDRASADSAEAVLADLVPNPAEREQLLVVFSECIATAAGGREGAWSVTLFSNRIRLNVGPAHALVVLDRVLFLLADRTLIDASLEEELGDGLVKDYSYARLPNAVELYLPTSELTALWPGVREAVFSHLRDASASRTPHRASYSPGIADLLRRETGADIDDAFLRENRGKSNTWLFQANPKFYDLAGDLPKMSLGTPDEWSAPKFRSEYAIGDPVLLWSAAGGGRALPGIYGVAKVASRVFECRKESFGSHFRVAVVITNVLAQPILKEELVGHGLADLSVIRNAIGTNHKVTPDQWERLLELHPHLADGLDYDLQPRLLSEETKETIRAVAEDCAENHDWQGHLAGYDTSRRAGQENWKQVASATDDPTRVDLILGGLLPHTESKAHKEAMAWVSMAPAIQGDVRSWFEGAGWAKAEDWPAIANAIYGFVRRCDSEPARVAEWAVEFDQSPLSRGFQTGMLSPILNALRPGDFPLVNMKSTNVLNFLLDAAFAPRWPDFAKAVRLLPLVALELKPVFDGAFGVELTPIDALDMVAHWAHTTSSLPASRKTKVWKIAPGERARLWEQWLAGAYASVGWDDLGDIGVIGRKEFDARRDELVAALPGWTNQATNQAWRFSRIKEGDLIVANRGTTQVVGLGRVSGPYSYLSEVREHKHRLPVEWFDVDPRGVSHPNWLRTLIPLDLDTFEAIRQAPPLPKGPPVAVDPLPPAPVGPIDDKRSIIGEDLETHNIILYGPPGTGKTYSTRRRAVELADSADEQRSDGQIAAGFEELRREGRVEMVTFHQSFGYEEFVEGIRPVQDDDGNVEFACEKGVFRRIVDRAVASAVVATSPDPTFDELWEALIADVESAENGTPLTIQTAQAEYELGATSRENIRAFRRLDGSVDRERFLTASRKNSRILWQKRAQLPDDVADVRVAEVRRLVGKGCHEAPLAAVHYRLRDAAASARADQAQLSDAVRAEIAQGILEAGNVEGARLDFANAPHFALVIDEINRGNISKILGELITLLEPSKRLGMADELIVQLPYSKDRFAVPPNLHIVGTMNTADRSIALMDVALRRRFTFEEMMPNTEALVAVLLERVSDEVDGGKVNFVNLIAAFFENLNARIRLLYDRDHQIGHSYFMDVKGFETLRSQLRDRVVPLLQEYFYGSWERVCLALGCPYSENGDPVRSDPKEVRISGAYVAPLILGDRLIERDLIGMDHDEFSDEIEYRLNPAFFAQGTNQPLRHFIEHALSPQWLTRYRGGHYTSGHSAE